MSTSWEVDAQSWYVGGAENRGDNSRHSSWDEWSTDLKGVISPQLTKNLLLRFGAEWERLSFGLSRPEPAPFVLHKVSALIGLDYQLTDQWLLRAEAQPGVYSDLKDVSWRDVDAPILLGAAYLANADVQWFFGLRLDFRSQYPALPALGVRWHLADAWTLNLWWPSPRLEYDVNDRLKAYLGVGADFGTFAINHQFGSALDRLEVNHSRLDYFEVRVGPGVSWKIRPHLTFELEGGCMVYRQFELSDHGGSVHSDPAPYVQVGCHLRF